MLYERRERLRVRVRMCMRLRLRRDGTRARRVVQSEKTRGHCEPVRCEARLRAAVRRDGEERSSG